MVNKHEIELFVFNWLKSKLNIYDIEPEVNLSNIGLDSFLAVQLICDVEDYFNIYISLKDILQSTSINEIINAISKGKPDKRENFSKEGINKYPLTAQQMAIYIASIKAKGNCLYNIPVKLVLPENINLIKLEQSIKKLLEAHSELNVELQEEGGRLYFKQSLSVIKLEKYFGQNDVNIFFRPFDLNNPPFIRIGLSEKYLLMDFHHIIIDGKSIHILLKELDELYQGKSLKKHEVQYSDYAKMIYKYAMRDGFKEASQYFATSLHGGKRVSLQDINGNVDSASNGKSCLYHFGSDVKKCIKLIKDKYNLTNTMVFLGVYCIILKKYTNQNDLLTSVTLMNRLYKEVLNTVGMFVNTLPVKIPDEDDLYDFMSAIKEEVLNLYTFQEVPLMEAIKEADIKSTDINTSFIYQADGINKFYFNNQLCNAEWVELNVSKFDLTFEITEEVNGYTLRIEYCIDKFSQELIDSMRVSYEKVILQILKAKTISELHLYDIDYSVSSLLNYCNNSAFNPPKCVHQLFTNVAYNNPKTAIVFEDTLLTYEQVEKYSNSLAYYLQVNEKTKADMIIPVIAERSWEVIVAMLAILKVGCAFVLIEPHCPEHRKEKILSEIKARIIITKGYETSGKYRNIRLEEKRIWFNTNMPQIVAKPNGMCYLIYTSGSTGRPKGIMISHKNVVNYCSKNKYGLWERCFGEELYKIISVTNISFDIFITESLFALLNGMTIYMTSKLSINNPKMFDELICKHKIQILQTTPSKMKLYLMDKNHLEYLQYLKVILLGGERVTESIYLKLREKTNAKIFNVYGPAETTVWVTCKELKENDVNIGTPLANNNVYIMSDKLEICPIGVAGEICIAGENVGIGYFHNQELTKQRFKQNPYKKGEIIYLTGDIGKRNRKGEIEYIGRKDNQIKLNGLRIELEEIEEIMSKIDGVISVAVKLETDGGRDFLVAFYVAETTIHYREWHKKLEKYLMSYMIPSYFVKIDSLPISSNGKIDRKNLPKFNVENMHNEIINKPSNTIEERVSQEICKLLKVSQIDTKDNILELGMDSLTIMQLAAILDAEGLYLDIQNIIEYPTIEGISNIIQQKIEAEKFFAKADDKIDMLLDSQHNEKQNRELGTILLTGVTGFLGIHIMKSLIDSGIKKIICPIRKKDEDVHIKFQKIVQYYFPSFKLENIKEKICLVECDLEKDNLNNILPNSINTVIHAAAQVKHFGQYTEFYRTNVEVTNKLLKYAKRNNAFFVYISTVSVSGNSSLTYEGSKKIIYTEKNLGIGQEIDNIYAQTKYEAEKLVLNAVLDGESCIIIRVGNLTNRRCDLKFQRNYKDNAFLSRLRAIILLGYLPECWLEESLEFSPVDEVANAITIICKTGGTKQIVYHVYNQYTLTFRKLLLVFNELGIKMIPISSEMFKEKLFDYSEKNTKSRVLQALIGIMDKKGNFKLSNCIEVNNFVTSTFLKEQGFEWKQIDEDYLKKYFEYFIRLNYLS